MADILIFIHRNPGCMLTDIYRNVTRNVHTRDRIEDLGDNGIIEIERDGVGWCLTLTERGRMVAEHLMEIDRILMMSAESPLQQDDSLF